MDWRSVSMFTKVPDMVQPLEETFASDIYHGWTTGGAPWEQLSGDDREHWREKARQFARGDLSVAPWQKKIAAAGKPSIVPAWI
jgi:hypothetical protein